MNLGYGREREKGMVLKIPPVWINPLPRRARYD